MENLNIKIRPFSKQIDDEKEFIYNGLKIYYRF